MLYIKYFKRFKCKLHSGGAMGIMWDEKLYFPDEPYFIGEDQWICLLNAYYNRKIWIDNRFAFEFKATSKQGGGMTEFTSGDRFRKSVIFIRKHFGDAYVRKTEKPRLKKVTEWSRAVRIPF